MAYQGIVPRVGGSGFLDKSREFSSNAIGARSGMRPGSKTETELPGKTAGGALSAGTGYAVAGYGVGASMAAGGQVGSAGGPWGAAIGACVGLAAYYLS